ncbi:hypothetical protein [Rheinheimera soli]|uniref:hypothetical protein n=1 Tax=Rheinheimera soli TaxID=443616 RepID=UPI001E60CDD2|nr:hypothetical protein [Rheinheimera soli]
MKGLIAALALTIPMQALAGYYVGKIQQMEFGPLYGDIVYVALPQASINKPDCVTNPNGYYFAFDSGTKIGEKIFSTLLAAQRSGASVSISGSDTCTVSAGVEDIRWIQSL